MPCTPSHVSTVVRIAMLLAVIVPHVAAIDLFPVPLPRVEADGFGNYTSVAECALLDQRAPFSADPLGCYSTLELSLILMPGNVNASGSGLLPSDQQVTFCNVYCELHSDAVGWRRTQILWNNGSCYCLPSFISVTSDMPARNSSCCHHHDPSSASCKRLSRWDAFALVYEFDTDCPLNLELCGVNTQCRVNGTCCVPIGKDSGNGDDSEPDGVRGLSFSLLITMVILQLLWCAFFMGVRKRRAFRAEQHHILAMRLLDEAAEDVELWPLTREEATTMAKSLLDSKFGELDFIPDHEASSVCVVCLEPLTERPFTVTSCSHLIHRDCLLEYLAHKLHSSLGDVSCPTCRQVIVRPGELPERVPDTGVAVPLLDAEAIVMGHGLLHPMLQPRPTRAARPNQPLLMLPLARPRTNEIPPQTVTPPTSPLMLQPAPLPPPPAEPPRRVADTLLDDYL